MELFCIAGTCSLAPHILLEEIGQPFKVTLLDRSKSEQKSESYLAINASGKVPALRIDGRVITENVAIQAYLADRFRSIALAPEEPIDRGQWLGYLAWLGGSVHAYFRRHMRPEQYTDDPECRTSISAMGKSNFLIALNEINSRLDNRTWIFGDQYTTADAYTLVFYSWARRLDFPIDDMQNLIRHAATMAQRPATQAAFKRENIPLELLA